MFVGMDTKTIQHSQLWVNVDCRRGFVFVGWQERDVADASKSFSSICQLLDNKGKLD